MRLITVAEMGDPTEQILQAEQRANALIQRILVGNHRIGPRMVCRFKWRR